MRAILCLLGILNILDGLLTYLGLSFGLIEEMNPVMMWVWGKSPVYFMLVKLGLSVLIMLMSMFIEPSKIKRILYLLIPAGTLYLGIFAMHLNWIIVYLLG